jgi:hypothetical protein
MVLLNTIGHGVIEAIKMKTKLKGICTSETGL